MTQPTDKKYHCSICIDDISFHIYEFEDTPVSLGCGHVFHVGCIRGWAGQKFNCPLCRRDIKRMTNLGPLTFESIERLKRRPHREEPVYDTVLRVVLISMYLIGLVKMLRSHCAPPLGTKKFSLLFEEECLKING